ncbi:MAG: helix-turn-helix transcriptional regulator [Clostridia bacterium]|nr:helix-turn-helix transcriptional regulator [Clostridia bacterium]
MKGLGKKLKYYRENCELSQQQVANTLNIDRSTYTYYETGKTTPSASTLLKLSKIFNVPCAVFLESINQELNLNSKVADSIEDMFYDGEDDVITADDRIYGLSKEEKELVISYRVLDADKKEKFDEFLRSLIKG